MLKKLLVLTPIIIILSGLVGLIWLFFSLISVKEKNINSILENEKAMIERVISDSFNHTFAIAGSMNAQIKNNFDNKEYINEILTKYKTSPNLVDAFSWTIFSWVDKKNQLIVDAKYGVMKTSIDLSDRDYLKFPDKTDELVIGRPVIGSTSKKWMIPAGISLLDKNKQYLGAMTIGFDIDSLAKIMQKSIRNNNVKFVLFYKNIPILEVRKSSFHSFKNNASLEAKPDLAKFAEIDDMKEVKVLLNPRAFHVTKFKEYPSLRIVAEYDVTAIKKELWSGFLSRILEGLLIIITSGALLFLLYRKEKLQSKIFLNLKNLAEKANKDKQKIIYSVSHDIRNYISRINNLSEIVVNDTDSLLKAETFDQDKIQKIKNEHQQNLKLIHSQSKELLLFVEDLLDDTQTQSGKFTLGTRTRFNIVEVIKDLLILNKTFLIKEKVTVNLEIEKDLPLLNCDVRRFKQIISNLLSNAAKYSNENGVITISAKHLKDSKQMLIEVSDQGIGMNEEQIAMALSGDGKKIEKLNLNKEIDSHGIGLQIVQQLIDLYEAKMEIQSKIGVGTTFRLFFPLEDDNTSSDLIDKNPKEKIKILVVDDQEVNLLMTKFFLEKEIANSVCDVAKSADEALNLLKEKKAYDLILTDIQMPKVDGFEFAKIVRKTDQQIPIIAYSSTIADNMIEKLHPEIDQFLSKPIKDDLLIKTITKWAFIDQDSEEFTVNTFEIIKDKKILIADDEELNLTLMKKILEKYEITVETALNGKELAEKYKQSDDFDLVISDIKMPIIDGFTAAKQIRDYEITQKFYHKTPIIAYSGDKNKEAIHRAFRSGIDDYYVKGESKEKLIKMIVFWIKFNDQFRYKSELNQVRKATKISQKTQQVVFDEKTLFDEELATIFRRDATRLISEIIQANKKNDLQLFGFASHTLKGICGMLKMQNLFEHVTYINSLAKQGEFASKKDLEKLQKIFKKTEDELLENFLNKTKKGKLAKIS